ncbi:tektin family protein [Opisthorchis viverrini]|uniref:Tektin n=1 Tax=Opisthorchis viverrini TaxID=6198 RepID=A0A1S8X9B7_OPIVI|nr:tektin family protein [Opisthorchis viverrini]
MNSNTTRARSSTNLCPSRRSAMRRENTTELTKTRPCGTDLPRYHVFSQVDSYYNSASSCGILRRAIKTVNEKDALPISHSLQSTNQYQQNALTGHILPQTCSSEVARGRLYPRYSEESWNLDTEVATANATQERVEAENTRIQAWKTIQDAEKQTREQQKLTTDRLRNRIRDIEYWRNELLTEIRLAEQETDRCREKLRILGLTRHHLTKPLQLAQECLQTREGRCGIDEVKDSVERALNKEIQVIKECMNQVEQHSEKGEIQLKLSQAAQKELQKDVANKNHAYRIDNRIYGLSNSSDGIKLHEGIELVDDTNSIPGSWVEFSKGNLQRSQKQRVASEQLRDAIDRLMRNVNSTIYGQFTTVNNALQTRIAETVAARDQLRSALKKVMQELYDTEQLEQFLRGSMEDKLKPLKLAETRLAERTRRQNVELCYDDPMKSLQEEIMQIRQAIRQMKDKLDQTQVSLSRLRRNKVSLEQSIAVKENSLQIDQRCLNMRKTFPISDKRGTLFSIPVGY